MVRTSYSYFPTDKMCTLIVEMQFQAWKSVKMAFFQQHNNILYHHFAYGMVKNLLPKQE